MIRKLLALLAVALVTTGCFEADLTLDVSEDGSGTFETVLAVDAAQLENAFGGLSASMGTDEEMDACALLAEPDQLAEGGTAEPYRRDDLCGFRSVEPFASPEELVAVLDGTFSDDTGVPDVETVSLVEDGDGGWDFSLTLPTEELLVEMPPQAAEVLGFDGARLSFRLRLPGRIVEHNGDRIEDGYVVWDVEVTDPPAEPLQARSEAGDPILEEAADDGGSATVVVVIVVAVVVVVLAAGLVLLRRRRATNLSG